MAERAGGGSADPARSAAYDVLTAVRTQDAYANLALPGILAAHRLSGRDAAFATELAAGTLRRRGTYEPVIRACLAKPRLEDKVLDVLLIGAHQLFGMRVPTHAAISTTVDLARSKVGRGPVGLVNAVLRRLSERELDSWVRRVAPDPGVDPDGFAAIAGSHPEWVVRSLREALGASRGDDAGLDELLAADNAAPRVNLVARPGLAEVGELPGERGRLSPYSVELAGGQPADVPAVAEGRAGVQDEGSQVVALAAAGAPVEGEDERWLDLCAGPGGKAALLAALGAQRGARVLAAELQEHRARLVRESTVRAAAGMSGVVVADGTRPAWPEDSFARVLLDAPCSGMGALRRRPESRWRRRAADLDVLVPLQRRLLRSALAAARPGGVVTYATCSPLLVETRGVVEDALGRGGCELVDVATALPVVPSDASGPMPGTLQLWPHLHATDAMFVALLRRT